ncbi:MAG: hypothetical protein AAB678_00010 [Patescibacteria group bacterium]
MGIFRRGDTDPQVKMDAINREEAKKLGYDLPKDATFIEIKKDGEEVEVTWRKPHKAGEKLAEDVIPETPVLEEPILELEKELEPTPQLLVGVMKVSRVDSSIHLCINGKAYLYQPDIGVLRPIEGDCDHTESKIKITDKSGLTVQLGRGKKVDVTLADLTKKFKELENKK